MRGCHRREPAGGIRAGEADRCHARRVECRHETGIHVSGQHGDHDVERRLVGDAEAVDLPLFESRDPQRRVDLFASAMHDHDSSPGRDRFHRGHD